MIRCCLLVMFLIGCNAMAPKQKCPEQPGCPEVTSVLNVIGHAQTEIKGLCDDMCFQIVVMGCSNTFGSPSVGGDVDRDLCRYMCADKYGVELDADFIDCVNGAANCEAVNACELRLPK